MTEADIDCAGLKCPEPVLRTRRALESAEAPFTVFVDNETARENVSRFARSAGCSVEASPARGGFLLTVSPGAAVAPGGAPTDEAAAACPACAPSTGGPSAGTVLLVSSDALGSGERELGLALMRSFLYATAEADVAPGAVVFLNSGVRLVIQDEEAAGHARRLLDRGTEIIACGACLDYYGLKDSLMVGRVGNMYEIQQLLVGAGKLVSL